MPGILHELACIKAVEFLGPGASTKHFMNELVRWFYWAGEGRGGCSDFCGEKDEDTGESLCESNCIGPPDNKEYETPDTPYDPKSKLNYIPTHFQKYFPEANKEIREMYDYHIVPDAYVIKQVSRDDGYKLFLIDIIEIDRTYCLRDKINRYSNWATEIDASDNARLRLRLFSDHFKELGEYDEEDLTKITYKITPGSELDKRMSTAMGWKCS